MSFTKAVDAGNIRFSHGQSGYRPTFKLSKEFLENSGIIPQSNINNRASKITRHGEAITSELTTSFTNKYSSVHSHIMAHAAVGFAASLLRSSLNSPFQGTGTFPHGKTTHLGYTISEALSGIAHAQYTAAALTLLPHNSLFIKKTITKTTENITKEINDLLQTGHMQLINKGRTKKWKFIPDKGAAVEKQVKIYNKKIERGEQVSYSLVKNKIKGKTKYGQEYTKIEDKLIKTFKTKKELKKYLFKRNLGKVGLVTIIGTARGLLDNAVFGTAEIRNAARPIGMKELRRGKSATPIAEMATAYQKYTTPKGIAYNTFATIAESTLIGSVLGGGKGALAGAIYGTSEALQTQLSGMSRMAKAFNIITSNNQPNKITGLRNESRKDVYETTNLVQALHAVRHKRVL